MRNSLHASIVSLSRFMSVITCLNAMRNFRKCSKDPLMSAGIRISHADSSDFDGMFDELFVSFRVGNKFIQ